MPGAPGAKFEIATNWPEFGYGRGLSRTLLTTLKTAVFAPMPMARVSRAMAVNPGLRRSPRRPWRRSRRSVSRKAVGFIGRMSSRIIYAAERKMFQRGIRSEGDLHGLAGENSN